MVASFDQAVCHLAAGIERVGDKVEGLLHIRGTKQIDHLVEQGAPITVATDEPTMDVAGQGDRKDAAGRVREDAHRPQGVDHDVFGLVGVRDLMQELGARLLLAPLGHPDAVTHHDQAVVDSQGRGKQAKDHPRPQLAQSVKFDGLAVKAAQQPLIAPGIEFGGAHQAGDAQQIAAHGESGGDGGKPQKGQVTAQSGSQQEKGFV